MSCGGEVPSLRSLDKEVNQNCFLLPGPVLCCSFACAVPETCTYPNQLFHAGRVKPATFARRVWRAKRARTALRKWPFGQQARAITTSNKPELKSVDMPVKIWPSPWVQYQIARLATIEVIR